VQGGGVKAPFSNILTLSLTQSCDPAYSVSIGT
jgi:hypothetical protein